MIPSAPRLDCTGTAPAVGYHHFHDDLSLNFQCNRWVQWIGPSAIAEVTELAARCDTYPEWIDGFLGLAEAASKADRRLASAYYDRAAEFFMRPDDPRRPAARNRFAQAMRTLYDVAPDEVPYGGSALPAIDLRQEAESGTTMVVFGGFDSYVEEFLPMLATMVDAGHRVIAFEGPGQGAALEEHGLPMIAEWERPVAAVLDHYRLDDVTVVGESLGGGLVIRAAAFEPRISRVVCMDILDDEFEVIARQIGRGVTPVLRVLLALRAKVSTTVTVRRRAGDGYPGVEREVPPADLVPGDVVVLRPGDIVPADVRVVAASGLMVDQSALSGEALPVPKRLPPPVELVRRRRRDARPALVDAPSLCFASTSVVGGTATG